MVSFAFSSKNNPCLLFLVLLGLTAWGGNSAAGPTLVLGSPYGASRILLDCRGGDAAASSGPGCLQGVLKLRGGVGSGVEVGGGEAGGGGGGGGGGGNDDNAGVGVNKQGGEEEDSDMSCFVSTIFMSDDSEGKGFDDALPQVQHATPKIYSIKSLPTNVGT